MKCCLNLIVILLTLISKMTIEPVDSLMFKKIEMKEGIKMREITVILVVLFLFGLNQPTLVIAQEGKSTATVTISGMQTSSDTDGTTNSAVNSKQETKETSKKKEERLPKTGETNSSFVQFVSFIILCILIYRIFRGRREND